MVSSVGRGCTRTPGRFKNSFNRLFIESLKKQASITTHSCRPATRPSSTHAGTPRSPAPHLTVLCRCCIKKKKNRRQDPTPAKDACSHDARCTAVAWDRVCLCPHSQRDGPWAQGQSRLCGGRQSNRVHSRVTDERWRVRQEDVRSDNSAAALSVLRGSTTCYKATLFLLPVDSGREARLMV